MLGHQSPKETLETYADLFDTDLDALADVLDQARAAALKQSPIVNDAVRTTMNGNGQGDENVPSTQEALTG
jgi:hypothetical protein